MPPASCGCCDCLAGPGPQISTWNRPGLSALRRRAGTHATFLEAMLRRLTVPLEGPAAGYSLHALTTRETDDPTIALLDAWAVLGDVLTFYQERLANEGYLRTAKERRSLLELGRLVGYRLKPGVAASVYLAYTLDDAARSTIPAGSKAQSIPAANEQPQVFETSEDTPARGAWNALLPRLSQPQVITLENVLNLSSVWTKGIQTRFQAGDPLLFAFSGGDVPVHALRRVSRMSLDTDHDRTQIVLEPVRRYYRELYQVARTELARLPLHAPSGPALAAVGGDLRPGILSRIQDQLLLSVPRAVLQDLGGRLKEDDPVRKALAADDGDGGPASDGPDWKASAVVRLLASRPALAPRSEWAFQRTLEDALARKSDLLPRLLKSFLPRVATTLYAALSAAPSEARSKVQFAGLHLLHRRAAAFGYNAPTVLFEERPKKGVATPRPVTEEDDVLYLDTSAEAIAQGSYVVVQHPNRVVVRKAREVAHPARTAYAISTKSTRLSLSGDWAAFTPMPGGDTNPLPAMIANLAVLRRASVLTDSEALPLAPQPIDEPVGAGQQAHFMDESATRIHLDGVVEGFAAGRWVVVTGERVDTAGVKGILGAELAMVAAVEVEARPGPGGTSYSSLSLAPEGLRHAYRRSSVKVYGNVVKATHGETRNEILGPGDASRARQTFTLHQTPLTFVAAPTPAGVESTLAVRVNDVLWHEVPSFSGATATDRVFVTRTADDGKVSAVFGDGGLGSRLPTGTDNVRAVYRSGIGKGGNVRAGQVATAISRPLGVRDVLNPLPAAGGADPESRDQARHSIPVSLQAMGRVISVPDFADFARTFAGIDKATALSLTDGRRRLVHLTVGGTGDIEVDESSDLYRNLVEALRAFGDPYQPFVVAPREKLVMAGSARVRVDPDYLWSKVAPQLRRRLLEVFSYDARDFADPIFPAEVVAVLQGVSGVACVDLDTLGPIQQSQILDLDGDDDDFRSPAVIGVSAIAPRPARMEGGRLRPAQIAYLPHELAELFVLTENTA